MLVLLKSACTRLTKEQTHSSHGTHPLICFFFLPRCRLHVCCVVVCVFFQKSNAAEYEYLKVSKCYTVDRMDDKAEFSVVQRAMQCLHFPKEQQRTVWGTK